MGKPKRKTPKENKKQRNPSQLIEK